jgi:hypothetical protein
VTIALAEHLPPATAIPGSPLAGEPLEHDISNSKFELAVRIANFLSRPIDYIDEAYCGIASFEPAQVKTIASHRAFRHPLNHAVAETIGFTNVKVDKEMMSRLFTSPSSSLAAVITTAPMAEVTQIAWILAPVVLSKRIRALVLKADREVAREAFGTEGFDIATHEAPVLHPALCELDGRPANEPVFSSESDSAAHQTQILEFGLKIVGRFLDASEPVLSELFARRLPPSVNYSERNEVVSAFGDIHREQFLKLIRRRQPSWAAIID